MIEELEANPHGNCLGYCLINAMQNNRKENVTFEMYCIINLFSLHLTIDTKNILIIFTEIYWHFIFYLQIINDDIIIINRTTFSSLNSYIANF